MAEYYLVNLLVDYARTGQGPLPGEEPLAMLYKKALETPPAVRVQTLKHLGDLALYVAGFFADWVERSLVDVDYYVSMGGNAYDRLSGLVGAHDQVPYMAKGMLKPFKVTPGSSTAEPASDVAVTLKEYTFEMPTELKAGAHTFKVGNQGAQPHEMILFKLAEGKTLADMQASLSNPEPGGPPPGEETGGAMPMAPGMRAWTTVDLKPGNYVAVCFVPDSGDGKPHLEHGMLMPITVK